jgi:hypothetical protein
VSFTAITLCVTSQRVFVSDVYFFYGLSPGTFGYTLVLCQVDCYGLIVSSCIFTGRQINFILLAILRVPPVFLLYTTTNTMQEICTLRLIEHSEFLYIYLKTGRFLQTYVWQTQI